MVTRPKPNMQMLSQTRGFIFLSKMFEGISNRMYGTKKMTSAMLYLLSRRRSNSVDSPNTLALAILTLESVSNVYANSNQANNSPIQESQ